MILGEIIKTTKFTSVYIYVDKKRKKRNFFQISDY